MGWKRKLVDRILQAVPFRLRTRLLRRLAKNLGVASFVVSGKRGRFEGATTDEVVHQFYFERGDWAPRYQELLLGIFREGQGLYFDIGANIGLTIVPLASRTNVRCIGFEPVPETFLLLQKNLLSAGVSSRVSVFNVALTDRKSHLQMEISDSNMGDSRVRVDSDFASTQDRYGESRRETVFVQGERFDSLVDRAEFDGPGPCFMKLDVQGAEVRVLRGVGALLNKLDFLYVEYWPYGMRRAGDSPEELIGFLRGFPYGIVFDDETTSDLESLQLRPSEEVFRRLESIPKDGTSTRNADLLLARSEKIFTPRAVTR